MLVVAMKVCSHNYAKQHVHQQHHINIECFQQIASGNILQITGFISTSDKESQ